MIRIKHITIYVLLLLSFMLTAVSAAEKVQVLDKAVAIVNDNVITQHQLDAKMSQVIKRLKAANTPMPRKAVLREQVLTHLINQEMELQMVRRADIKISDEALNDAIAKIASRNGVSVAGLKRKVRARGENYQTYREQIRDEMAISRLEQETIGRHIIITDQDVTNYLDKFKNKSNALTQYHLKNILIPLPDEPSPTQLEQAKQKAQSLVKQLHKGANFEKVAVASSGGEEALQGGDLGWRKAAQLPDIFQQTVVKMKPGQVAGPLRAPNGYHILKLVGVRGGATAKHYSVTTKVRHILIAPDAITTSAQAKQQLLSIREQISTGKSFAKLAKEYSDDTVSAANGGELGWVSDDEMVAPFRRAMDRLKIGQLSQPVHTQFGWHLIEVQARRKKEDTNAYRRAQVKKLIYQRKFEEGIQQWVQKLRDSAYIKRLP